MSEDERDIYWDDLVHLTPKGYKRMGEHIGSAILPTLKKEIETYKKQEKTGARLPPGGKRRREFKDDENQFKEEEGDPTLIDQGYVVVRRKDLD